MVGIGDLAPEFTLKGACDGEIREYTLSDYTATGPVLLGVYVFDFSPVCSTQMCDLRDMDWYRYKKDLSLFGISTDGPYSHVEFAEEEDLGFPLLSDTSGEVLDAYGVLNDEVDGQHNVPQRSLFLVDADRRIEYKWVADDNWTEGDFGIDPVREALACLA